MAVRSSALIWPQFVTSTRIFLSHNKYDNERQDGITAARFMRHVSATIRGHQASRLDTNSQDMKILSGSDHTHGSPSSCNHIDTIGNAVTILAPCVTARVLCELNEARRETEKRMTAGAVNDESRDMTVMAQYDQEIFDFMREMEASH
jgi:hypothetical protein